MVPPRSPPTTARSKSVMFCQVCGHESPIDGDGDWNRTIRNSRVDYSCPECDHLVTSRPIDECTLESDQVRRSTRDRDSDDRSGDDEGKDERERELLECAR